MRKIKTISELCEYLNSLEDYPVFEVDEIIKENGWHSTYDNVFDVCDDGAYMITMMDNGLFKVVEI
ncbi:MAG: hypothetical protein K5854_01670 [Prevotella sp.]|nr:hypothetical protein [Prevotella sp.]